MKLAANRLAAGSLIALLSLSVLGQEKNALSGRVVASGMQPVGTGVVYLHSSDSTFRLAANVGPAGTFRFEGVPAGRYELCASPGGTDFVDSCLWNRMGVPVTVSSATKATSIDVPVQKAAKLKIQLSDTQAKLDSAEVRNKPLQVSVWADLVPSLPVFASVSGKTSRVYEISVPMDVELSLGITGPSMRLSVDGITYDSAERRQHRFRIDSKAEVAKTVSVSVLAVAP